MKEIVIRRPTNNDIEELNIFFALVVKDTYENEGLGHLTNDINDEIQVKMKYLYDDISSNGELRYFLLACHDNKIIGTIEYGPSNPYIRKCVQSELDDVIEIGTVFVLPEHQGKGIGNILINSILITLQSRNINEFCLDSGYKKAQKIWTKKFGKAKYIIENFWAESFHHMIWYKSIDNEMIHFKIH